jgi:hypothetical protein
MTGIRIKIIYVPISQLCTTNSLVYNDVLKILPTTLYFALQIDGITNQLTTNNKYAVVQYFLKECSGEIRCSFIGLVGPTKARTYPLGAAI